MLAKHHKGTILYSSCSKSVLEKFFREFCYTKYDLRSTPDEQLHHKQQATCGSLSASSTAIPNNVMNLPDDHTASCHVPKPHSPLHTVHVLHPQLHCRDVGHFRGLWQTNPSLIITQDSRLKGTVSVVLFVHLVSSILFIYKPLLYPVISSATMASHEQSTRAGKHTLVHLP